MNATFRRAIPSILTLFDSLVVVIALVGGMNMLNVNVRAAIGALLVGTLVAISSIGLWTQNRYLQLVRIVIYTGAAGISIVSFAVVALGRGNPGLWPMPLIVIGSILVSAVSILHL